MAKNSMIAREVKRARTVKRYAAKRTALKAVIKNPNSTDEARDEAQLKLQELPRDASPTRVRSLCALTGRSRGVYQKFKLSRIKLRELALQGKIPGMRKASW